jgi:hypothetical protein
MDIEELWEKFPYNYMRWHRLAEVTDSGGTLELDAASSCDGILVLARWRRTESGWMVEAMDSESQEWCSIESESEEECVPPFPPPIWSDSLIETCREARKMYEAIQPAGGWQHVHDLLIEATK